MSFVLLDNKNWCKGIYHKGDLHFGQMPDTISKTWKYSSSLKHKNIQYASLFAQGKEIEQCCPEALSEQWAKQVSKLSAYHNSFVEAKINLEENCFYDLVPSQFLLEFCSVKCKVIEHVLETYKKPENYNLLLQAEEIISDISEQKLNIDLAALNKSQHQVKARRIASRLKEVRHVVDYNLFGTKTGRLTTKKNTFPILNLDSDLRFLIKPKNDLFVELDYNAAEVRVLLALAEQEQPNGDIHEWNAKKFSLTREQAKQEIFAWLYGSTKIESEKYENYFQLDKVLEKYYDGKTVTNFFKRQIEADDFHKLNYLIQSTSNDLVLNQIYKIKKLFENRKSFISFIVHDSLVIDLAKEDKELIKEAINIFSNTNLGQFPVNISAGKDYGSLRKVKC